jgi:excisionase family DNA binding protein
MIMEKLLLTTTEAAMVLGIGRTKLYEYLATRELPAVRIGRSVRIHVDDVRQFAEGRRQSASGRAA